jgi:signal transduction histidine kinase
MLLFRLDRRIAALVRLAGLVLIGWSVLVADRYAPGSSGRGLVVTVLLVLAVISWLAWVARPTSDRGITPHIYLMAAAGGVLCGATPGSAASAFVFVAVVSAAIRVQLPRAAPVAAIGTLALAISVLVYDGGALRLLAYALGFLAALLASSNVRQSIVRADQAELLLAQTQRSQEEQLRAARLEESTRIAREIHDVLAHTLAGLTIQLEATGALIENGAERDTVLARVRRAHALARDGMRETRRAVGALRGETGGARTTIEALVAEYESTEGAEVQLTVDGDPARLTGETGQAVLRAVQEALTNVHKHAPGAAVSLFLQAGDRPEDDVVLTVQDRPNGAPASAREALADSGGGFGLRGARERAQLLGGALVAGPFEGGWRVQLRLPAPGASLEASAMIAEEAT